MSTQQKWPEAYALLGNGIWNQSTGTILAWWKRVSSERCPNLCREDKLAVLLQKHDERVTEQMLSGMHAFKFITVHRVAVSRPRISAYTNPVFFRGSHRHSPTFCSSFVFNLGLATSFCSAAVVQSI